jgi:hypothetical protein
MIMMMMMRRGRRKKKSDVRKYSVRGSRGADSNSLVVYVIYRAQDRLF